MVRVAAIIALCGSILPAEAAENRRAAGERAILPCEPARGVAAASEAFGRTQECRFVPSRGSQYWRSRTSKSILGRIDMTCALSGRE